MIRFLFVLIIPFMLNASNILSYNIYDRTDRADVMITFDTPYTGKIKQSITASKIIIKLENAKIESAKFKQVSSKFLQSLNISPMAGYTQIVATVPASVKLRASKTADAYGLRLRFTNIIASKNKQHTSASQNSLSNLPTKQALNIPNSYYIVITILIVSVLILFYIKTKVTPKQTKQQINKWSFKQNNLQQEDTPPLNDNFNNQNVSIRFQKNIDGQNSVVMLDFLNQSYLVLMGNSNILLDKFTDNVPTTQEGFEQILQSRHKELDDFIQIKTESTQQYEQKEPLQIYKEKAASISYESF